MCHKSQTVKTRFKSVLLPITLVLFGPSQPRSRTNTEQDKIRHVYRHLPCHEIFSALK